jgi:multidrug resistance efflux pump
MPVSVPFTPSSVPAKSPVPPGPPRLRLGLVLSEQRSGSAAGLVLKDPSTGRYFRFGMMETFILRLLDGALPLETVRLEVEKRFNAPLPLTELEGFVGRLRSLGLIEDSTKEPAAQSRGGRVRGNLLYLRLPVFDPDRLLDRLAGKLGFFFTPRFVVGSAICIAAALAIAVANQSEIAYDVRSLYNLRSLVLGWMILFAVIVVHELAHGLTCKRFGGSVREMGFILIFFQPAFYCNVSDAWLFPEKSRRLWVTFAGAYSELFLWALATLTWRLTEVGTVVSRLALLVMVTSAIKTLFNLNPLIKLDGYYLLSDYLEIPNLRRKARAYVGAGIQRLTGGGISDGPRPSRREARIFLFYGLVAGAYSFWLLGCVALWFGRFLVTRYQGFGFVLFAGLLLGVFGAPAKRSLGTLRGSFRSAFWASFKRIVKVFAVLAAGLAILWFGKMDLKVSGDFTIVPAQNADVRADIEGIIEEIRVEEGDRVAKGDVIARLSDRDYLAEMGKVKAQIEESQARLRLLREGPRAEELSLAQTAVEKAQERLGYADRTCKMLGLLLEQNLVSQKEFAEAKENLSVRQKELEEAEGRLKVLRAGSRPEEIESVEAESRRWEVHRNYLEQQLQRINILSPIAGVVTTPKLKERVGEHVNQGDLVAKVFDVSTVTAEIAVPEVEISDVRVGQQVELRARSFPQRTFHGAVASIAPTASASQGALPGKTVLVTTKLPNPSVLLKPEMTGTAKIVCGRARLAFLMTRRLRQALRVEFWSWW